MRNKNNHKYSNIDPIDIVYTWVNGNDLEWQKKKTKALHDYEKEPMKNGISSGRFEDHDELKYSLRSIDMYIPWVNRIYIITDNQIPEWLDTNNPKITIIDHREIFPKDVEMPVYNSALIELFIHNIKGLSNKFIYFNDDILINRPLSRDDFFTPDGKPIFYVQKKTIDKHKPAYKINFEKNLNEKIINNIINFFNSRDNLNWYSFENSLEIYYMEHPEITETFHTKHLPKVFIKKDLINIFEHYVQLFQKMYKSKFRSKSDLNIATLFELNTIGENRGVISDGVYDLFEYAMGSSYYKQDIEDIINIFDTKYKFISISQGNTYNQNYIDIAIQSLNIKFPLLSKFEKPNEKSIKNRHVQKINKLKYIYKMIKNKNKKLEKEILQKDNTIEEQQKKLNKIYKTKIWKFIKSYLKIKYTFKTYIIKLGLTY